MHTTIHYPLVSPLTIPSDLEYLREDGTLVLDKLVVNRKKGLAVIPMVLRVLPALIDLSKMANGLPLVKLRANTHIQRTKHTLSRLMDWWLTLQLAHAKLPDRVIVLTNVNPVYYRHATDGSVEYHPRGHRVGDEDYSRFDEARMLELA